MTTLDRIDLRPDIETQEIRGTLLSKPQILRRIEEGSIVIDPLDPECINSSSVDVKLGPWYFRAQKSLAGRNHYSPYSEKDVKRVWGEPQYAEIATDAFARIGRPIDEGIFPDDYVIIVEPGESLLMHTEEFIGGRINITQSMQARSTAGRNLILVCKCAGWGDIGYINRWTMEVKNDWEDYTMALVVGRRYAQLIFQETGLPIDEHDSYGVTGKYQTSPDLAKIKELWTPWAMLPQMYRDREITRRTVHAPTKTEVKSKDHPDLEAAKKVVQYYADRLDDQDIIVVSGGKIIGRNCDAMILSSELDIPRRDMGCYHVGTVKKWIALDAC